MPEVSSEFLIGTVITVGIFLAGPLIAAIIFGVRLETRFEERAVAMQRGMEELGARVEQDLKRVADSIEKLASEIAKDGEKLADHDRRIAILEVAVKRLEGLAE